MDNHAQMPSIDRSNRYAKLLDEVALQLEDAGVVDVALQAEIVSEGYDARRMIQVARSQLRSKETH